MNTSCFFDKVIAPTGNTIRRWCEPLETGLGVDYFSYQKVKRNGEYTFLSSHSEYIEYFLENSLYRYDPYLVHSELYKTKRRIQLIHNNVLEEDNPVRVLIKKCKDHFGFRQGVLLTFPRDEYYETYCFSTKSGDSKALSLYLNEMDLLIKFTEFFKKKARTLKVLSELSEYALHLPILKGQSFYSGKFVQNDSFSHEKRRAYLRQICPEEQRWNEEIENLTRREKECLKWTAEGRSARETGRLLGISPRTVERHIANAREKLPGAVLNLRRLSPFLEK